MFFAVIDERQKESLPEHETQLSSIRWHLSEGLYMFSTFYVSLGWFHFDFTIFSKEKWELFQCIYEVNVYTCIQSCLLSILWLEFLIAMVDFYYYLVFKLNV